MVKVPAKMQKLIKAQASFDNRIPLKVGVVGGVKGVGVVPEECNDMILF